jgi:ribonuclease PH
LRPKPLSLKQPKRLKHQSKYPNNIRKKKKMSRVDGRLFNELRNIKVTEDFVVCAEGSFLVEVGRTRVLCNATMEEEAPRWLKGTGKGWVTAEYSLLPRSTARVKRERSSVSGRTQEIQRLIGRALRGVVNLENLGERNFIVDCDVLEADGGTRTASIVGGFLALARAMQKHKVQMTLNSSYEPKPMFKNYVSAVSVGLLHGEPLLDLCYTEDSAAEVDMNVVMADSGDFVEVQGTGEESVFSRTQLNQLLDLAEKGCREWLQIQKKFIDVLP